MDFAELLLRGCIPDDELGDFVSIAAAWRMEPNWLNADIFKGKAERGSVNGLFVGNDVSGTCPDR